MSLAVRSARLWALRSARLLRSASLALWSWSVMLVSIRGVGGRVSRLSRLSHRAAMWGGVRSVEVVAVLVLGGLPHRSLVFTLTPLSLGLFHLKVCEVLVGIVKLKLGLLGHG